MPEPEDFGLNDTQTLAQVADATLPGGFVQFWSQWSARTWGQEPRLEEYTHRRGERDAGAPGVTHTFRSTGGARIGCRLILPEGAAPPRGVVVTTHGYGVPPGSPLTDENPWSERGLAVLKVRVRGYPGSQMDTGDLTACELGYITLGLNDPNAWVLGGAAADVVNACRAAGAHLGPGVPLMLHGESFGGGLAVLAASLLAGRLPVERLAVGLPSLGWWSWRLERPTHAGAGLEVRRFIDACRGERETISATLRLFDAVVHARRVACASLCKVAVRDDVVPSPTVAAIYNALGADPGMKWRFLTRFGHYDGGLADLRRHAAFERLCGAFLDPGEDLHTLMRRWEPVLTHGERPPPEA